jgi:Putative Ig domain
MTIAAIRRNSQRSTKLQGANLALVLILLASLISSGCAGYTSASKPATPGTSTPPSITTGTIPNGVVGHAFQAALSASGGTSPYTWSMTAGALPLELRLDPSSGMISGTPSQAGQFNFTVQVADSSSPPETNSKALSMTVASAPATLQISTSSLANGQVQVAYSAALAATGGTTPYSWSVSAGSLPTGLTLSGAGVITGTPSAAGTFNFTAKVTDSESPAQTNTQPLSIVVNPAGPQPLAVATTSLPGGVVGSTYSSSLAATGGTAPYSWSISAGSLPTGLGLSGAGAITGTPSASGTFNFTVKVTDSSSPTQSAPKALSIVVAPSLAISTTSLTAATQGSAYSFTLAATGGTTPYSWSIISGSLPTGLTLSGAGSIAGAPSQSGTFNFTVQVKDSESTPQTRTQPLSLTVNAAPLNITTTTLPAGTVGTAYNASFAATGGVSPYTWSVLSGSLPAGLSLSGAGAVSGTPSAAGTASFQVQVKDSTGATNSAGFSINVVVQGACGGPLTYCSRTDMAIAQLPSPIPNVGGLTGAGTIVTPSDFNNPIERVTDGNTDPSRPNIIYDDGIGGSADENVWNTDSTLFVVESNGANYYVYSFDPSTMAFSRLYTSSFPSTNGLVLPGIAPFFSRVNSQVIYGIEGSDHTTLMKYDFTDRSTPPSPQTVYDFRTSANCLGEGYIANPWSNGNGVDATDSTFGQAFGNGQDTAGDYVAYRVGQGCSHLNINTGVVTGDWGSTGPISTPVTAGIHNSKLTRDGNWAIMAVHSCSGAACNGQANNIIFWQVGTTTVHVCTAGGSGGDPDFCQGHWAEGYTHWVNNDGGGPINELERLPATPGTYTNLVTNFPATLPGNGLDEHQSWENVDASDSVPFFLTSILNLSGCNFCTYGSAWEDEVLAVGQNGTVYRFAHTFNTDLSQAFSTSQAIGSVSQDGKWFLFSSDWMGTLGAEGGGATCTIGSNCRGDAFIVKLR